MHPGAGCDSRRCRNFRFSREISVRAGLPDRACEPLIKHASHFHARGARKGRLQAAFPQNTIDYGNVLGAMQKAGYNGYVGVEYVWIDWEHCNEVDNLSETIQLRDFLRAAMDA